MRIEKLQIADIDKLIALQEKHIVHNLTHEQQTKQGFVTTRFTSDLLIELQREGRSFVLYAFYFVPQQRKYKACRTVYGEV